MGAGRMKSGPSPPQAAEHRQQALTLGKLEFLNFDGGILQHSHEVGVEMVVPRMQGRESCRNHSHQCTALSCQNWVFVTFRFESLSAGAVLSTDFPKGQLWL